MLLRSAPQLRGELKNKWRKAFNGAYVQTKSLTGNGFNKSFGLPFYKAVLSEIRK